MMYSLEQLKKLDIDHLTDTFLVLQEIEHRQKFQISELQEKTTRLDSASTNCRIELENALDKLHRRNLQIAELKKRAQDCQTCNFKHVYDKVISNENTEPMSDIYPTIRFCKKCKENVV